MPPVRTTLRFLLPPCLLALSACSVGPGYYWQAARGQFDMISRAENVREMQQPEALRQRLATAIAIREFASRELGLPDNGSYRRYADLQRPFAVWNVFASPALSLQAQNWCVPVAGCISYLGFFSEADARAKAAELRTAGLDVHVAGIAAYSTLGWFDDPLLNTFMQWPEHELARLIFHELAHQKLYVKDDTEFNESFAAAVEEAGVRRWLAQPGKEALHAQFDRAQVARSDFAALVMQTRDALATLYASSASDAEKQQGKRALIANMQKEYQAIKATRWGGFAGYDRWFAQDINNATINSVGLYKALVPGFLAMLAEEDGDMARFYARVGELAEVPAAERRSRLAALLPANLSAVR